MKNLVKIVMSAMLFSFAMLTISCSSESKNNFKYIATTKWVAGVAEIAGIENIKTFAPSNMVHPPEYELKPDDVLVLSKAEVVFYAGYETKMMQKINDSLGKDGKKFRVIQITTENSLNNIKKEALRIATELGTIDRHNRNIKEIENIYSDITDSLKKNNIFGKDIYCHTFQKPFAESLGFKIAGTFGPAPVSAINISEVAHLKPVLIIDNYHNEIAKPLGEVSKDSVIVSFLNFPGHFNTNTIKDVLLYNKKMLLEALNKK
jgi:zinc transport system substrate-binding protein